MKLNLDCMEDKIESLESKLDQQKQVWTVKKLDM